MLKYLLKSTLIQKEVLAEGKVPWSIYSYYFLKADKFNLIITLIFYLLMNIL
jgi:hypothetical protein